jgi:4,5-dihydroxyphthalate decarboxylase
VLAVTDLPLTVACGPYDRTQALIDGIVTPEGIDLLYLPIDSPPEIFTRMVRSHSFDVAEMSLAHYLTMRGRGEFPFIALPVFPSRVFRHSFIFINRKAGIVSPKDLEGRRIGLRDHRHTAAVWIRGALQDEAGVDWSDVHWFEGGVNAPRTQDTVMEIQPDRKMTIEFVPGPRTLSDMLADGELDAIIGAIKPDSLDTSPNVERLFSDYRAVERDYFSRTGIFPIMHTLVMPEALHAEHPWVAKSLYRAFEEAKTWAQHHLRFLGALRIMVPWLGDEIAEIDDLFGGDAFPYGLEANRETLETFIRYLAEQGYLPERPAPEELFAAV